MSQKQLNRYVVIEKSLEGILSVKEAAETLKMSTRQVIRLRNAVIEQGAIALVHKNQGRKPPGNASFYAIYNAPQLIFLPLPPLPVGLLT